MIYLYILGCLAILGFAFIYTKNIASPLFINSCVWLISYILILIGSGYGYVQARPAYGIFLFADIAFSIGFAIRAPRYKVALYPFRHNAVFRKGAIEKVVLAEYVFATVILLKIIRNITLGGGNIWVQARRNVQNAGLINTFEQYFMTFVYVLFIISISIYFSNPTLENKINLAGQIYPIVPILLVTHRGNWIMLLVAVIFSYIYIKRPANRKIVNVGLIFTGLLILLIIVSAFWKFSDIMNATNNTLIYILKVYFISPFSAFVQQYGGHYEKLHGTNTFRIVFAVLQRIGFDVEVNPLMQSYIYVDGMATNVYTSLGYYMSDFGINGLMIIEMVFGFLFAGVYKKIWNNNREAYFHICVLAFFMYSIINQFFDDKMLSIASTWIQIIFWSWLLTRDWLLKVEEPEYKQSKGRIKFTFGGKAI